MNLPRPDYRGLVFEEALLRRRSRRDFTAEHLTIAELSQLVFAAQGVTEKTFGTALRTAPSAGALYPYEIYLMPAKVEGLAKGIYRYSHLGHSLSGLREGDFRLDLTRACLGQAAIYEAAVNFILVAVVQRILTKYGQRGHRYIYMEAGHISQNLYLQAASLGLGTVVIGAFHDDDIHRLLGIDGKREVVIAVQPVGKLRP